MRRTTLALLVALLLVGVLGVAALLKNGTGEPAAGGRVVSPGPPVIHAQTPAISPAPVDRPSSCAVTELLVDPCRPWFGGTANRYPRAGQTKLEQMLAFERRTGRRVEVAHTYHPPGDSELSEADLYFARRPGTHLITNWTLTEDWQSATGRDPSVNAQIDHMAESIGSLGSRKIMVALATEPENKVTAAPGCEDPGARGTAGTPADYRAMWANVRARFAAAGVDNVVWVLDFMNFEPHNCLIDALYPGDDLVDWIVFNGYQHGDQGVDFVTNVRNLYDLLTDRSRPGHDYLSKQWGLVEWGINNSTQENAYLYYAQARAAVEQNLFPRLRFYLVFDDGNASTGDFSHRVSFATDGQFDQTELDAFNQFAHSPAFNGAGIGEDHGSPGTPGDLVAQVRSDGVRISWSAPPGPAPASYEVFRDGVPVAIRTSVSYRDKKARVGGTHAYAVRALSAARVPGPVTWPVSVTR